MGSARPSLSRLVLRGLLGKRLPKTQGRLVLPGVEDEVVIRRDRWGIPYIEAQHPTDAWFGLGFCQGQDRAFQLELALRAVRGTLAALLGPPGLLADRMSRRIGFARAAGAQLAASSAEVRAACASFAQGVTLGGTTGLPRRPHEFALLRAHPTPFEPVDAVGLLGLLSFVLGSNWDSELIRLRTLRADGVAALRDLEPCYPEWLPVSRPPGAAAGSVVDRLAADVAHFLEHVGSGGGSNSWAVAAARTQAGRPLLASDPHLGPRLPSHWYLAHVRTPSWSVGGASLVGAPGFVIAHNEVAAWGVTAGLIDNTDLFLEEVSPDGLGVRCGETFVPCEIRRETIEVRGAPVVTEEILVTPRGPVISPALENEAAAISLRAVWLDPHPIDGFLGAQEASTFEDFRTAFERWPVLPLNLTYADTTGTIGWQLAGQAPRRRKGHGMVPLAGWDPAVGWEPDGVPFADMPYVDAPSEGFVATANNCPTREGEGPFLGSDWVDGYRAARIAEALTAKEDWSVSDFLALQVDTVSLPWRELRSMVLACRGRDAISDRALVLLEGWNGDVAADSVAATLFELWLVEMARRVVTARAPHSVNALLGRGTSPLSDTASFAVRRTSHLVRVLRDAPEGWFESSWSDEIAAALAAVWRALSESHGTDPAGWSWGHVRPVRLDHPFAARPLLRSTFCRGPFPCAGDTNTISQASVKLADPFSGVAFAASLRAVFDVGCWDQSRFVLAGGQSGNPFSPHYDDQLQLWLRGEAIPMAWTPEEVALAATDRLELAPSGT